MKLIPCICTNFNQSSTFNHFLQRIGSILLEDGFISTKDVSEEYSTIRLLCLGKLAESEPGKSIL